MVETSSDEILCVLLTFAFQTDVYLLNVYSRSMGSGQESPAVEQLSTFLSSLPENAFKIVGFDFNCLFEPLDVNHDDILSDEDRLWAIPALAIPPITKVSPLALQINALTLNHSIWACNG